MQILQRQVRVPLPPTRKLAMPHRTRTACAQPGCPNLTTTNASRCPTHLLADERQRGSSPARGYGRHHARHFRAAVLTRDPTCVICRRERATIADHYPLSRRQLVSHGLNPDNPKYGRGLCKQCDSKQTAERQPGGWNKYR